MLTKKDILDEIRKTTKENGGIPLGRARFEKETGIKPYDWEKYWVRLSDAQKEAGFTPNKLTSAYTEEFLINKMIGLIGKLGKFPVYGDLKLEARNNSEFPEARSFFETKEQKLNLATKIIEYCQDKSNYSDIINLCSPVLNELSQKENIDSDALVEYGEVYLFKSGRYYKIGRTNDTVRRGTELKIQLPEAVTLIHSIKTDDPSGVEAYWHKRFQSKCMNNSEWFNLNASDVRAFKRWRKII